MSTATIISNIQRLPVTEQFFVIEQIMHSLRTKQIDRYLPQENISEVVSEEILVLPDWQKKILQQRLESVEQGNTVSQEEAHKIFEQCLA
ncbi:MAG: addiction module protein [Candidatus Azobacteroides sp.]|nr:addiction module protein [Candidatus Azobacteroides sp.]